MNRRSWLMVVAAGCSLAATGCSGKSVPGNVTVSRQRLQEVVASRFPRQFPVAGMLQLQLHSPTLALLPERNALNAVLQAQLSGPVLKQAYAGHLDLDFALRYEPTDRTLRAHQIKVNTLVINDLAPAMSDMLTTYAGALAEQALGQLVLYQLQDKELALVDSLNLEPGTITVTPEGLSVALVHKAVAPR
ncbi:DUF1439 domain-containing protein [Delftia tsuruhatensis]|uniref:DUF1439 domain-containing protein n=2 Tax=Delftia tsuruhatensis TaxID=180282 RepID=UPI001F188BFA|nr:DUF1439 domain-containing protein [Delftia tsuruhatensis]